MILYFSGTGNSKYAAQRIADGLGDTLCSMNERIKAGDTSPVETGSTQVWFVMTCGSEIGSADKYNRALCREKGLTCMGTAHLIMPENYIAMFNAPQPEEARQIAARAEPDIDRAIAAIREERAFPPTRCKLYDRFMSGPVNPIFYGCFVKDRAFTVSDACIGCGQCARLCPTNNITLREGKPVWGGDCTPVSL